MTIAVVYVNNDGIQLNPVQCHNITVAKADISGHINDMDFDQTECLVSPTLNTLSSFH